MIKLNPFAAVEIERHKPESFNVIQPEQQNIILKSIDNPRYLSFFWFLCCTGLRISEAVKSIPYIDFDKNVVNVVNEDTATKKHKRQVPFLPELITPERYKLLKTVTVKGASEFFKKLYKKLGYDFVPHSCRHTFISCCYHVGFRDKWIQVCAGHSSIKMTMDTYTHILSNTNSLIIEYFRALKSHLGI
jgi:integrase